MQGQRVVDVCPWLKQDLRTIQLHRADQVTLDDEDSSDEDVPEGVEDPLLRQCEQNEAINLTDQIMESLDVAQAKSAYDWVAATWHNYTPEEIAMLKTHLFNTKGPATSEEVKTETSARAYAAEKWWKATPLCKLRDHQTVAVVMLLEVARQLLYTGVLLQQGDMIGNLSGTAGSSKTVRQHTACYALCSYAEARGVPEAHLFARVLAPTGCAAVVAGGQTCHSGARLGLFGFAFCAVPLRKACVPSCSEHGSTLGSFSKMRSQWKGLPW